MFSLDKGRWTKDVGLNDYVLLTALFSKIGCKGTAFI